MRRSLAGELRCPYCNGGFAVVDGATGDAERVEWGLLRCRCFEFPVVDGVLLLSLAKGYGGPEDELHPYAPLLVAAVDYLQRGDVDGLRGWIGRHLPDVVSLLTGGETEPYLALSARLGVAIAPLVERYLDEMARYEVIGTPAKPAPRRLLRGRDASPRVDRAVELSRLADYYATRFFSARGNALAVRMCHLAFDGPVLSLCCGHGVFENFARRLGLSDNVVSLDAQFVNLLIARRYANPGGDFIVHDVQFPLPFPDGVFAGVFSSTCLPELPSQASFVAESIRVAAPTGWSFFDRIWNAEVGARRIERNRHYRFAQNFFASLEDYVALFRESATDGRRVGLDIARPADAYVDEPGWAFDADGDRVVAERASLELSAIVVGRDWKGFAPPDLARRVGSAELSVSPAFDVDERGDVLALRRRPQVAHLEFPESGELDASRFGDAGYLLDAFCRELVAALPARFDSADQRVT